MPTTIYHEHKLVLIHPQRTAGTSIYYSLLEFLGPGDFQQGLDPHRKYYELLQDGLEGRKYYKVMTVRSPFDRIRSWVNWHRKNNAFNHTLDKAISCICPLTEFGLKDMDFLIRQESLEEDFKKLCLKLEIEAELLNLNQSMHFPLMFTPSQYRAISCKFREDIEHLLYADTQKSKVIHLTNDLLGNPNGYLATLWNRNYDKWVPDQVYLTVVNPASVKGPHLHGKRIGRFFCIKGTVQVILKRDNQYEKHYLSEANPTMLEVPTGVTAMVQNYGTQAAYLLNMPSPAWKPDDQDELEITDWNPPDNL